MTSIATPTIPVSEAALLLRLHLGPLRNWTNFLNDNIRGLQSVAGHTLMPCGRRHDGKAYRPVYAVRDVMDFIAKVLSSVPSAGKAPIKPTTLPINRGRHWRINKFDRDGAPVATMRFNPTGGGGLSVLNSHRKETTCSNRQQRTAIQRKFGGDWQSTSAMGFEVNG